MPMSVAVTSNYLHRRDSRSSSLISTRAAQAFDLLTGHLGLCKPVVFVSGFWRSGTTWMQELLAASLNAKTVFEPLCPQNPAWRKRLLAAGVRDPDLQEAFIPGLAGANDPMWRYLDAAFRAAASSPWSVTCRGSVGESFRREIIVKDVHLQLNLAPVHHRYGVPVVHLRRHPCAIVASLMSAKWGWSFKRLRLPDLIAPFRHDLSAAGLPDMTQLAPFDDDVISRTAAFWAITERLVDVGAQGQPWATILSYEDAVRDPEAAVRGVCRLAGRSPAMIANPDRDSASTQLASHGIPPKERPHAWRSRLSAADIDRVHRAVDTLYPAALAQLRDDAA